MSLQSYVGRASVPAQPGKAVAVDVLREAEFSVAVVVFTVTKLRGTRKNLVVVVIAVLLHCAFQLNAAFVAITVEVFAWKVQVAVAVVVDTVANFWESRAFEIILIVTVGARFHCAV